MNRPRNRQRRQQSSYSRPQNSHSRAPPTLAQSLGTVPTTAQVYPGATVSIVLKEDQPTGKETQGTVQDVLTKGDHPKGIKVRLRDGRVGRVQGVVTTFTTGGEYPEGPPPMNWFSEGSDRGGTVGRASAQRGAVRYTDVRNDGYEEPPPRTLADWFPDEAVSSPAHSAPKEAAVIVKCPFCDEFEGDEVAVSYHVDCEHLT